MKFCPYYFQRSRILGQCLPGIDFGLFSFTWIHIISRPESRHIPVTYGNRYISLSDRLRAAVSSYYGSIIIVLQIIAGRVPDLPSDTYVYRCVWSRPPFPVTAIGSAASCKSMSWNTWYEIFKVRGKDRDSPLVITGDLIRLRKYWRQIDEILQFATPTKSSKFYKRFTYIFSQKDIV